MRDITLGETFYHFFTTRAFATGVPTTLAGTPALSVREENNATAITAGVSLSVDIGTPAVTGLNQGTVIATGANGYEAGKTYALYVSTGTVGGTSVVGEVVEVFTVQASAAFTRLGAPAGASVSADVAAVQADTDNIQTRLPAALVSGRMDSTMQAAAVGVIASTTFAAGAIDSAALAADVVTDIWMGTTLTEAYAADGAAFTPAQGLYQLWAALSEFAIAGTTVTAKKLDGSTTAMTFTLDSATSPTSRTRAT